MPEATVDSKHFPALSALGPLEGDLLYRCWVMPPGHSITALVMRELVGDDDLQAARRAKDEDEEVREMTRQAVVAFSTAPVPVRKVRRMAPTYDAKGDQVGEEEVEEEEHDLDSAVWQHVDKQPFPEFDRWKVVTRKVLLAYYNQLNGLDLGALGKSLASGRGWSPGTKRTTTEGQSQSPPRHPTSPTTAAPRPASSTAGSVRRATRG